MCAVDKKREEKAPGPFGPGQTLRTRGVDLRACALKVDGYAAEA
jgi:hypothetical protein